MGGYPQRNIIFEFDYFISLVRSMGCSLFSLPSMRVLLVSATSWFGCVAVLLWPLVFLSLYVCKLPKSLNADKQRDFLCLTDNATLFVVTNNRFAKQSVHRRTVREEERFRALEIDTIIRKDYLEFWRLTEEEW